MQGRLPVLRVWRLDGKVAWRDTQFARLDLHFLAHVNLNLHLFIMRLRLCKYKSQGLPVLPSKDKTLQVGVFSLKIHCLKFLRFNFSSHEWIYTLRIFVELEFTDNKMHGFLSTYFEFDKCRHLYKYDYSSCILFIKVLLLQ